MAITPEQVEEFFKALDWPFKRTDDHNWVTGFQGDVNSFDLYVRTTDYWLYVYMPFPAKVVPEARANLHEHLLRLNFQMNLAKAMLDDENNLGMTVEIPNANLQVGEFEDALRALCVYGDRYYIELVSLATNPQAVSSLKPLPPKTLSPTQEAPPPSSTPTSPAQG